MTTEVGVVGYGTIGKRVADAVRAQPDMALAGVAKRSPDYAVRIAARAGVPVYPVDEAAVERFEGAGIAVAGDLEELVERVDCVVDATPSGVGAANSETYAARDTPAVFQGGEDAAVAETSFTARVNYGDAVGADSARVLSCNSTGMARVLDTLDEAYGVDSARATLVRRGGDPAQSDRGPIDDILPDPLGESHHAPDVKTVLPEMDVRSRGVKVPATLMHLQTLRVTLSDPPADVGPVRERLAEEPRVFVVDESLGIDSLGDLMEYAKDLGRPRNDLWENCLFGGSLDLTGEELSFFQAIHQESDVVPENVDAVRALTGSADAAESQRLTDESLGVGAAPGAFSAGAMTTPGDE